jgi:glycosyltransferase involved in cell wall biosynthesis
MLSTVKDNPTVTIVTVSYNSAKYIREAIESVLAQDYQSIEYIIADDCSTDNTWDIIQEYKDPRLIKYRNENNLGEYGNRNKAISMASGKYLLFIDGDDYIYSHALPVLVNYMECFPEAGLAVMCHENLTIIFPALLSSKMVYQIEFSEFSLINTALTHTFFRTDVIRAFEFPTNNSYISKDVYIRLKIALHYPCLLVNGNLTWWRATEGQASQKLRESMRHELYAMSTEFFNDPACQLSKSEQEQYLRNSRIKILHHILQEVKRGNFGNAIKIVRANNVNAGIIFYLFSNLKRTPALSGFSPSKPLHSPLKERWMNSEINK